MDESLVHTSFLLHDHTLNSMLGNIVSTNRSNGDPPCWQNEVFLNFTLFKLNMDWNQVVQKKLYHNIGRGLLMIDIEAIIRYAGEKLKYCFENYNIRRYMYNDKISRTTGILTDPLRKAFSTGLLWKNE